MTDFIWSWVPLAVVIWLMWKGYARARANLQRWVDDQGYSLVTAKRAWFRKAPYTWTSTNNQILFRFAFSMIEAKNVEAGFAVAIG